MLATEAMINAIGVDYALKGITGRESPFPSNFQNIFFHGGTSFPSDHSAVTWAFAVGGCAGVPASHNPDQRLRTGARR